MFRKYLHFSKITSKIILKIQDKIVAYVYLENKDTLLKAVSCTSHHIVVYGTLNGIVNVVGSKRHEISASHLIHTYYFPSLIYSCSVYYTVGVRMDPRCPTMLHF